MNQNFKKNHSPRVSLLPLVQKWHHIQSFWNYTSKFSILNQKSTQFTKKNPLRLSIKHTSNDTQPLKPCLLPQKLHQKNFLFFLCFFSESKKYKINFPSIKYISAHLYKHLYPYIHVSPMYVYIKCCKNFYWRVGGF